MHWILRISRKFSQVAIRYKLNNQYHHQTKAIPKISIILFTNKVIKAMKDKMKLRRKRKIRKMKIRNFCSDAFILTAFQHSKECINL